MLPFKERLSALEKVLSEAVAQNDLAGQALLQRECGYYADLAHDYKLGLRHSQTAIDLCKKIGNLKWEAIAWHNLGVNYSDQSLWDPAIEAFHHAAGLRGRVRDTPGMATEYDRIANVYYLGGSAKKAVAPFKIALGLWKEIGDPVTLSVALDNLGAAYFNLDQYGTALDLYRQANALVEKLHAPLSRAITLNNMAVALQSTGQTDQAYAYLQESLKIRLQKGDKWEAATTLANLASLHVDVGQFAKALEEYDQAALYKREAKDDFGLATVLNNEAETYQKLGSRSEALRLYSEALAIRTRVKDQAGLALTYNDLGTFYIGLGQRRLALENLRKSLKYRGEIRDQQGYSETLGNLGAIHREEGDWSSALYCLRQAQTIQHKIDFPKMEATTLSDIGDIYIDQKRFKDAIAALQSARVMQAKLGDREGEALTLASLGKVYLDISDRGKAKTCLTSALAIDEAIQSKEGVARNLTTLSKLEADRHPDLAIWYAKRAVNTYQGLRKNIRFLSKETRASYRQVVSGVYRRLADLLTRQGRILEAEKALWLLKDDELYRYLRGPTDEPITSTIDYTPAEAKLDAEYELMTADLAKIAKDAELVQSHADADAARLKTLITRLNDGEKKFQEFLNRFLAKASLHQDPSTKLEKIRRSESIVDTLAQMPSGTVAVYAFTSPEGLRLLFFAPGVSVGRIVPLANVNLNNKIKAFRNALTDPLSDPRHLAKEFYDWLVRPIEKDLAGSQATRIMWSLDGALRYLPIGALYDGQRFLIDKFDLSLFTPSAAAKLERNPPKEWRALAAGMSKPVKIKDGMGNEHDFPKLSGVPSELAEVCKTLDHSQELLDSDFTVSGFETALARKPSLVHLATHYYFQPGDEANSFLLTGDGGQLRVTDAKNLSSISFQGVSLLTLSACDTALGGGDGAEVEGMSAVFQDKGAESVIATLWSVSDEATPYLMSTFYRQLRAHPDWSKLQALQAAQKTLLHGDDTALALGGRSHAIAGGAWPANFPRYSHPFYWAPFVLMGNWK